VLIDGNTDDGRELQQQLDSMETRWDDVVTSAAQQSKVIDSRLTLWSDYTQLLDRLHQTADELNQSISEHPVTSCDAHQATQLLDHYHVSY